MRHTLLPLAVAAALAGCKSENELVYTATLQAETNGVVLSDDGLDGYAAMSGTTCTIDVNWGCPTADEDLPTDREAVVDQYGPETLGVSELGLHSMVGGHWDAAADIDVPGVRTGRITDGGHLLLGSSDGACWLQHDGDGQVTVPDAACADDAHHAVDRANGTLFAGTARELWALSPDGAVALDARGPSDLLDWDPTADALYVAGTGGRDLRALDGAGEEMWSVRTRDPVRDLVARGDRGEALVLLHRDDGLGTIERRDGVTGRVLGRSVVPTADGHLVVSRNGVRVAIVRGDDVNFFALETDGEDPVVDPTPPTCITIDQPSRD